MLRVAILQIALYLAGALAAGIWSCTCAAVALRLHRRIYPNGIRLVIRGRQ